MYIIIGYIFAKTHNCYVQCTVLIQKKLISTSKPPLLHHVIITWIRMTINLISYFVHTDCEPPKIMIHSMITWFLRILVKSRSLHSSSNHEIIDWKREQKIIFIFRVWFWEHLIDFHVLITLTRKNIFDSILTQLYYKVGCLFPMVICA